MFVRSFFRSSVRAPVTKSTMIHYEQTVEPRSANFRIQMHVANVPSPANFHPNPNVLYFQFQGQRLESNTLASAYLKIELFCTYGREERTDNTDSDDVKGCRDRSRGIEICQGVSRYVKGCRDM